MLIAISNVGLTTAGLSYHKFLNTVKILQLVAVFYVLAPCAICTVGFKEAQPPHPDVNFSGDEIGLSDSDFERESVIIIDEVSNTGSDEVGLSSEMETDLGTVIIGGNSSGDELGASSESDINEWSEELGRRESPMDIEKYNTGEDSSGDELGISSESDLMEEIEDELTEEGPAHSAKIPSRSNVDKYISAEARHSPTMLKRACSLIQIKSTLKQRCKCPMKCVEKFSVKTLRDVRTNFWSHPKHVRFFLLNQYSRLKIPKGKFSYIRTDIGELVCTKAFLALYMINKNSFTRASKLQAKTVGLVKAKQTSTNTVGLISWFEEYVGFHGDFMPHNADVMLPYGTIKIHIYEQYKVEADGNHVSKSTFFDVWNKYFPHIKIKKSNTFSKCTVCALLDKQMQNSIIPEKRALVRRKRRIHNDRQMKERVYYYSKREQSRVDPKKFLSIIIDGMDQSKTNLPHFKGRLPKSVNAADLLKTHITGVISHGHGGFHTFTDFNQYPHDPNLTINIILKMLMITTQTNGGQLPPVLYIQADNCPRENKNRYVLAFLQLLVEKKIFKEVHLSCLPVGHTHEDIDARFSLIARRLYQKDTETLSDFLDILDKPRIVKTVYDVKSWLIPNMPDFISGTSEPLHYKFERIDNVAKAFYKGTEGAEWKVVELGFLTKTPTSKPKIIRPDFAKLDEEKFRKLVKNNKCLFKNLDIIETWEQFLKDLKKKTVSEKWILPELPVQHEHVQETIDARLPDELEQLLEKENREPQIRIKMRKNNTKRTKAKTTRRKTKSRKNNLKVTTITKTLMIPLDSETKKHIWIVIFFYLYFNFCFSLMAFCLYFIQMLMFTAVLYDLLLILQVLWSNIVSIHVGSLASVNEVYIGLCSDFLLLPVYTCRAEV